MIEQLMLIGAPATLLEMTVKFSSTITDELPEKIKNKTTAPQPATEPIAVPMATAKHDFNALMKITP